jgi:hypothetical protein
MKFSNNFHFYFAKFCEIRSRNFAKFCEIKYKFREIQNKFLVQNFAKFRIAKFRIHPSVVITDKLMQSLTWTPAQPFRGGRCSRSGK